MKTKRIFRDSKGRITKLDLRKIKSVTINKRRYTNKNFIRKLVLKIRKEKSKQKPKITVKRIITKKKEQSFKEYQTQLGKLGAYYNRKYNEIVSWLEINSPKKFIDYFIDFYDRIGKVIKAVRVKFGITIFDKDQDRGASWYTPYLDILEKNYKSKFKIHLIEMFEKIQSLSEQYEISLKMAEIETEIIYYIFGNL